MQRILIIGDGPTLSDAISSQLQACSIEITEGNAEALQLFRQRPFELVVTNPQSSVKGRPRINQRIRTDSFRY
jgi:CheY-like chemotaxis protein